MPNRLSVCVHLDFFLVTIARQINPALEGVPLLIGGDPQRHGRVIEASPEAMAQGVFPGLSCWEALRRCPEAVWQSENRSATRAMSTQVRHLLEQYGPHVEQAARDLFFVDKTGGTPDRQLGGAIQAHLRRDLGLTASVGVAANRLVARLAATNQGPGSLVSVPAGQEASFLAPLPLAYLPGLTASLLERLSRLGVKKIGDLQAVSQGLLAAQLGQEGRRLYNLARGREEPAAEATITAEEVFDHRLGDPAALRRWVVFLCGQVGRRLRESQQAAGQLTLTMGHPERPPTVRTVRLPQPSDVDQTLSQAVIKALEGYRLPGEGVVSLEVEAGDLREGKEQLSLVPDKAARKETKLRRANRAANGIKRRHGEKTIMVASLLDEDILKHLRNGRGQKG